MLTTDDGSQLTGCHQPCSSWGSLIPGKGTLRGLPPRGFRITLLPVPGRRLGPPASCPHSLDLTPTSSVAYGTSLHPVTEALSSSDAGLPLRHYVLTTRHLPFPARTQLIPSLGPLDEVLPLKRSPRKP